MKTGHSQWRKLDNAAIAFPAVTDEMDTRVFRFYCLLRENVDGAVLQKALDRTMEKYPLFQAVMRKGLFWYYLEHREIQAAAQPESRPPCSALYIRDKKSLLFQVTWYENRINFEVFHGLTDGTGALYFLRELVKNYLILAHPDETFPELSGEEDVTGKDMEEDSFSQYYSRDIRGKKVRAPRAYQLHGEKVLQKDMRVTEVILPVSEVLTKAREYGVSITVYLTAVLLTAIHREVPKNQWKKPVGLMIPVNLRNYFPSRSMTNFFGWIEVRYVFSGETTLADVVGSVKAQFERELDRENIARRMSGLVRLEKHPVLRAVPLELKKPFLMAGTRVGHRGITAVYSNVGVVRMPPEYEAYIERFGLFCCAQSLHLCSCSFGNDLALGFTTQFVSGNVERNFLGILKEEGLSVREEENRFPGRKEGEAKTSARVFEWFTFLCILTAVLCAMVDFIPDRHMGWSWFVAAGAFCSWLLVSVAWGKRRNILKDITWELLIVCAAGILWDVFTGWRGWSVDILLPVAILAAISAMIGIAATQRMEREEYIYYLLQTGGLGIVPLLLVLLDVVRIDWPSVLCVGVSFMLLVWLFLFRRREALREMHKKLRM
ncbi:MAG: DUF6320 domain-containing protein [Clostridiales bacterium]|nr:DUF6320 domain-containing protein [Clostridiales bacterium]